MMRDDILKRKLRSGRPEPSGMFSERVHKTLKTLPKKGKGEAFGLLPASALVFAAVAALCVFAVSNKTVVNFFSPGAPRASQQQAAGAPETPSPTPTPMQGGSETPMPTPTPSQDDSVTPAPTPYSTPNTPDTTAMASNYDGFMQTVNQTSKDSGYELKLTQAGIDGYVLCMKTQRTKMPAEKDLIDVKVLVDGTENTNQIAWYGPDNTNYTLTLPLTCRIKGDTANIEMVYTLYATTDYKTKESVVATFDFKFDLPVYRPSKSNATGSGSVAFGNDARLEGVYREETATTYVIWAQDNSAGDLQKYFSSHAGSDGNSADRVLLDRNWDPKLLIVSVCKGLVGKDYIGTKVTEAAFNVMVAAGDDDRADGIYIRNVYPVLEKESDGSFLLYVINLNPDYQPETGFTILSRLYTRDSGSQDTAENFVLQIKAN